MQLMDFNVLDNLTQKAILMFETVHFRAKL